MFNFAAAESGSVLTGSFVLVLLAALYVYTTL